MGALHDIVRCIGERCPGGRLPDSYLVFDLETSGFVHTPRSGQKADVIVQLGIAAVRDRKMTDNMAVYIKRPKGTMSDGAREVTGITDELLMKQGVEPREIYPKLINLFQLYHDSKCMFVGHNACGFDIPFFVADCKRHGFDFRFRPGEVLDTGMVFKAAQIRLAPGAHEDLHRFFCRIKDTRSRAKWNLTYACQMLNIDKERGLDMEKAHDAAFDCWLTHLLFEELRRLAVLSRLREKGSS